MPYRELKVGAGGFSHSNAHALLASFRMPRVSEFFGITIAMYFSDHPPPHFHAKYAEHEALIEIETLAVLRGFLPSRARSLVLEWAVEHREALWDNWRRARAHEELSPIPPLE